MRIEQSYEKDFDAAPRPRALIVLMDGTWNDETGKDGDGVVTNVVKLFRCLGTDNDTQLVRYFRGVGNDEDNGWLGRFRGGAFGRHEAHIRRTAYATIAKEWRPGDRIFLFGFSRGAASARMLARDLRVDGIPRRITVATETKVNRWTNAIENHVADYTVADATKRDVDVEFLGVWDTVAAFGLPFNRWDPFKDMHVSSNVRRAVHLVSVDETRKPFRPTLMNHNPAVVEEVWFPGVHSDVGGGYARDELGRITLRYMVERLREHVAEHCEFELAFDRDLLADSLEPSTKAFLHLHGLGFGKAIRDIHVQVDDRPSPQHPPKIHRSVLDIRAGRETYSVVEDAPWIGRPSTRTPRITYHPPNVKQLGSRYEVVDFAADPAPGRAGFDRPSPGDRGARAPQSATPAAEPPR